RKCEAEAASLTGLALDPDSAAVRFDDSLLDRQSQADAASIGLPCLPEALEQVCLCLDGHTRPGIGDLEHRFAVSASGAKLDVAAGRRELHGVAEQIAEHLGEPSSVGAYADGRARIVDLEHHAALRRQRS